LDKVQAEDMKHLAVLGTPVNRNEPNGATHSLPDATRNRLIDAVTLPSGYAALNGAVSALQGDAGREVRANMAKIAATKLKGGKPEISAQSAEEGINFAITLLDDVLRNNKDAIIQLGQGVREGDADIMLQAMKVFVKNPIVIDTAKAYLPAFLVGEGKAIAQRALSSLDISPEAIGAIMPPLFDMAKCVIGTLEETDAVILNNLGKPMDRNKPDGEKHSLPQKTRNKLIGAITSEEGLEAMKGAVHAINDPKEKSIRSMAAREVIDILQGIAAGDNKKNAELAHAGVDMCITLADTVLGDDEACKAITALGEQVVAENNKGVFKAAVSLLNNDKVKLWVTDNLVTFIGAHKEQIGVLVEKGIESLKEGSAEIYLRGVQKEEITHIAEKHAPELLKIAEAFKDEKYMQALGAVVGMMTSDPTVRKVVGKVIGNAFDHMVEKVVNVFKGGKQSEVGVEKGREQQIGGEMRGLGKAADHKKQAEGRNRANSASATSVDNTSTMSDKGKEGKSR
jgi:hypothetical protein